MAKALTKELKQPDEFVSFWTHFGAKLKEHRRAAIALVSLVVVGSAAGWGLTAYRNGKAASATDAFARIDRITSADLLPEKEPEKAAGAAKETPKVEDSDVPRFKTEKERLEAANKEADAFIARFGAAGIGRKALLGKASRLLAMGNAAEAGSIYESLAAGEKDPGLRAIQEEGAAAAKEAEGKLDEALRAYTAIADEGQRTGAFFADRALYAKARLLEKQGKAKDAEKVLREILEKMPKTLLRSQIDDRLAAVAEK